MGRCRLEPNYLKTEHSLSDLSGGGAAAGFGGCRGGGASTPEAEPPMQRVTELKPDRLKWLLEEQPLQRWKRKS